MTIKSIIWDLGGVLVRTDDRSSRNALASELGLDPFKLEAMFFGEGLELSENPQVGGRTAEDHIKAVCEQVGYPVDNWQTFRDRFFAGDVLDATLVEYIRSLKEDYHIALLSNAFDDLRTMLTGEWDIIGLFDTVVISGEVGLKKPDPAIYELTLEKTGFIAEESVFIDDFERNIKAANALGIHGIRFLKPDQARKDLSEILSA